MCEDSEFSILMVDVFRSQPLWTSSFSVTFVSLFLIFILVMVRVRFHCLYPRVSICQRCGRQSSFIEWCAGPVKNGALKEGP